MMRSMYAGVAGLKVHQLKMDVIGNNIANVNTVGYKKGQVAFQDLLSQAVKGASAPSANGLGGTNPQQVGLGVGIGEVSTVHTEGSTQTTNNPTDLKIDGNGYFVVTPDGGTNSYYTRAGNFKLDRDGNLLTSEGMKVMGYQFTETGEATNTKIPVRINLSDQVAPVTTKEIEFGGNLNSSEKPFRVIDTTKTPAEITENKDNVYLTDMVIKDSKGNSYNVTYSMTRNTLKYEEGGVTKEASVWEVTVPSMTAVGSKENLLAGNDINYIVRFDNNGKMIGMADANGGTAPFPPINTLNPADIDATKAAAYVNPDNYKDAAGNFIKGFNLQLKKDGVEFGDGIDVDGNGTIEDTEKGYIKLDFAKLTEFGIDSSAKGTSKIGNSAGTLTGFSIGQDGVVTGVYSNGEKKPLSQIMLAKFDNPAGLEKKGGNLFSSTPNSGVATEGKVASSGFGKLTPGSLEMSNVDLSMEFTEMITTQRGFQANSRIITTSDEMLQELVNLKR